jgi:hypothetical protein
MYEARAARILRSLPAVFWNDRDQVTGFSGLALACCGGPLLISGLAAAGALAWGAAGLGAGVLVAVTVPVIGRRLRSRCGRLGRACTSRRQRARVADQAPGSFN